LFVNDGPGWPFYARPTRGTATVTPPDVDRVRARQHQLGIPETFEWIAEVTPSLGPAASATGLAVTDHPLLALQPGALRPVRRPAGVQLRLSVEPMAQRLGEVHYQALHHFVAVSPWDWRLVRRRLAERLVAALGPTAWVVDDTGFPKDGTHSVGGAAPVLGHARQDGQLPAGGVGQRRDRAGLLPVGLAAVCAGVLGRRPRAARSLSPA
jgi:hypothetical protein